MARFKFVHAADLHLDTPFEGIGKVDASISSAIKDASLDAFDSLIDLTIDKRADFLVLAGDLYDGADRGVRAQLRVLRGLKKLSDAGIRTFIIYGNHDPLDGWSAIKSFPEKVTTFLPELGEETVVRDGQPLAVVQGISYGQNVVTENLSLRFRRTAQDLFHLGILHCNIGASADHPNYSACSLKDLSDAGMDYWALGHIHKRQVLSERNPTVIYPGNLQGRSTKESELGPKGAYLVQVGDHGVEKTEFYALDKFRFIRVNVDITDIEAFEDLEERLEEEAAQQIATNQGRALLVRGTLLGRSTFHQDLNPERVADLLKHLRQGSSKMCPTVWWERLSVETLPPLNIPAIRERGDFSSVMLTFAEQLEADETARNVFLAEAFDLLKRKRLPLKIDWEAEAQDLLRDAKERALDALAGVGE